MASIIVAIKTVGSKNLSPVQAGLHAAMVNRGVFIYGCKQWDNPAVQNFFRSDIHKQVDHRTVDSMLRRGFVKFKTPDKDDKCQV